MYVFYKNSVAVIVCGSVLKKVLVPLMEALNVWIRHDLDAVSQFDVYDACSINIGVLG